MNAHDKQCQGKTKNCLKSYYYDFACWYLPSDMWLRTYKNKLPWKGSKLFHVNYIPIITFLIAV